MEWTIVCSLMRKVKCMLMGIIMQMYLEDRFIKRLINKTNIKVMKSTKDQVQHHNLINNLLTR